jgi:hypothetical protein
MRSADKKIRNWKDSRLSSSCTQDARSIERVSGQKVEILGLGNTLESVVASVEAFNRTLDRGGQGSGTGVRGRFTQTPGANQLAEIMAFAPPRNLEAIPRPCPPPGW